MNHTFDPRFPWFASALLAALTLGVAAYYAAVLTGVYKEPLLARMRAYGTEAPIYPLCRFLEALAAWSLLAAAMTDSLRQTSTALAQAAYIPLIFLLLGAGALVASLLARRIPALRAAYPDWYRELLANSSRLERRFIAYAWLRIPRRMRWRLNGDHASFRAWADTVRMTVTYGALGSTPARLPRP